MFTGIVLGHEIRAWAKEINPIFSQWGGGRRGTRRGKYFSWMLGKGCPPPELRTAPSLLILLKIALRQSLFFSSFFKENRTGTCVLGKEMAAAGLYFVLPVLISTFNSGLLSLSQRSSFKRPDSVIPLLIS